MKEAAAISAIAVGSQHANQHVLLPVVLAKKSQNANLPVTSVLLPSKRARNSEFRSTRMAMNRIFS
jgi:hypothetical protein